MTNTGQDVEENQKALIQEHIADAGKLKRSKMNNPNDAGNNRSRSEQKVNIGYSWVC